MFHGPCFQGVAAVERSGEDGLVGTLEVLPTEGLFRSDPRPAFVTDPVVLDAAGQLVGFWAAENLDRGFVVFPYRVAALDVYQGRQPAGARVSCRLRLQLLGNERMRSDLEMLAPDGSVWMRLSGWEDRRFDLPEQFHRFWVSPGDHLLSRPWPLSALPEADSIGACRTEACFSAGDALWQDLWASLILSRKERAAFRGLGAAGAPRTEWLTGTTAAKDAVRVFLKERHRLEVYPADIEIDRDERGGLAPHGSWTESVAEVPSVTLAQSNGVAVAIARRRASGDHLGMDLRAGHSSSSGAAAAELSPEEQELLASVPPATREEWSLRLRSAKEATARALGRQLPEAAGAVRVRSLGREDGVVRCAIQGELANLFPQFAGVDIHAYTAFEDDVALAVTFLDEASP